MVRDQGYVNRKKSLTSTTGVEPPADPDGSDGRLHHRYVAVLHRSHSPIRRAYVMPLDARHRLDVVRLLDDGGRLGSAPVEEDPALDPPRHHVLELVADVRLGRNGEDLVELLEGELLGLADEAEDHEPRYEVEAGVEPERTGGRHDGLHAGEGQRKDAGEGVVDAHGPGHALLTLDGGEHLGGVLESDGALSERVADGEEVDEEHDGTDPCTPGCIFGC